MVFGVSTSPTVNGIGPIAVAAGVLWFGISPCAPVPVMVGASFTGNTINLNEVVSEEGLEPVQSVTLTVMLALPLLVLFAFRTGVSVRVRELPVPLTWM